MFGEIRRSQVITTFGIGAIVDLKTCSAVMKSPDVWPISLRAFLQSRYRIEDTRLSSLLGSEYFVQPPSKADGVRIPVTLFPRMLYCPSCRTLKNVRFWFPGDILQKSNLVCNCRSVNSKGGCTKLLPSRFIVICPKGHMDDFPYYEWVHREEPCRASENPDHYPQFEYMAFGGGASLADIRIKCKNCDKSRSMSGALTNASHKHYRCSGNRPEHFSKRPQPESCGASREHLRFVLRNATNVYFPRVYSSLLIPPFSQALCERIQRDDGFRALRQQSLLNAPILQQSREYYIDVWSEQFSTPRHIVEKAVDTLLTPQNTVKTLEQFKAQEFCAFTDSESVSDPNFKIQAVEHYELRASKVCLLCKCKRLREVRVLTGFSRVSPLDSDFNESVVMGTEEEAVQMTVAFKSVAPKTQKDWLPAIEVFGEGIFVAFDDDEMARFENASNNSVRTQIVRQNAKQFERESQFTLPAINGRLIALHTLAHVLIKRIAFESGFSLPSLRERIYCDCETGGNTMNGLLIYTADVDAEGTMGGLSRLANDKLLSRVLEKALQDVEWCSSDPVCRESKGQGLGSLNLAACHSCCLLPETCCEFANRFLDRELLEACFRRVSD